MMDLPPLRTLLRDRAASFLFDRVDGAFLACFRIVFGAAMAFFAVKQLAAGNVAWQYIDPPHHFHYYGFEWVKPWPGVGMYAHFAAMAIVAVMLMLGLFYRVATIAFALLFTWVFLLDRSYYLNHYYLIVLLSWMMTILPADKVLSLDALQNRWPQTATVPAWTLWLIRFYVALPYFFGGIAKIDGDWMQGQPMRLTLSTRPWYATVTEYIDGEILVQVFTWGGMLFDLLIVPALLWRRTRAAALCLVVAFHLTNAFVFPIGVFPWLMIAATLVFLPPEFPRRLMSFIVGPDDDTPLKHEAVAQPTWATLSPNNRRIALGLAALVLTHCLLPFRYQLLDGDPNWTERGHCFSWHMMLRSKFGGVRVYVTDRRTGKTGITDLRQHVTAAQIRRVYRDPEHIRQLAHYVADYYRERGRPDVEVRVLAPVSLNGRKPRLMIDPRVDLAAESASWTRPDWILPLTEPLRHDHWDVPIWKWEQELGLDPEELLGVPLTRHERPAEQATTSENQFTSGTAHRNEKPAES